MPVLAVFAGWLLGLIAVVYATRQLAQRRRARERVFMDAAAADALATADEAEGFLSRWLYLAGYRGPQAAVVFLGATFLLACVGAGLAAIVYWGGLVRQMLALLALI